MSKEQIYLEGYQPLWRCDFHFIEKELKMRNIPEDEIQEYKEALTKPVDTVTLRCPGCGNEVFEGRRTDRVYLGEVDGEVDIIEDPHDDGELDDDIWCSKCGLTLDRYNIREVE